MNSATELRVRVLEDSLEFEHTLSFILTQLFKVSADAKIFGDTGAALSFQTKIDFLRDLGRITKDQYNHFGVFIEIRNKIIHNIEIDSLEKAVNRINKSKLFFGLNDTIKAEYDNSSDMAVREACLLKLYKLLIVNNNASINEVYRHLLVSFQEEERAKELKIASESQEVIIKRFMLTTDYFINMIRESMPERVQKIQEGFLATYMKGREENPTVEDIETERIILEKLFKEVFIVEKGEDHS